MLGLLVTGLYYLAASLVFPERPEEWQAEGLDAYYMLHRRQVVSGVAACNVIAHAAEYALGATPPLTLPSVAFILLFYALLAGVALVRSKAASRALLGLLIASYAVGGILVRALG